MADLERSGGLRTIFSFFLGLMVTAFVGVGVYTFYPPPQEELARQIENLDRQEVAVRGARPPEHLTDADRARIQTLTEERNRLEDGMRDARRGWGRVTSIILIVLATLAMAVSITGADRLPVVGNGLLMGGLFTMVYGVGWVIATDTSVARFIVMTAALAVTLGLGYVRFVRREGTPVAGAGARPADVAELDRRVRDLEARLREAAGALGQAGGSKSS
jgi:hypothetical protein